MQRARAVLKPPHSRRFATSSRKILTLTLFLTLSVNASFAQWTNIGAGISYREFTLDGPVRVFVTRADRSKNTWTIDSMTSMGEIKGGHETIPNMAARYEDSVTFDGHRYDVKVAINGDYYDGFDRSGYALSGQIMGGWFAKRYTDYSGSSGFVWTSDRRCFLGGNVQNIKGYQRVTFADKTQMKIDQYNDYKPRKKDSLELFTPQFAANTGTTNDGIEVVVRMSAPTQLFPQSPGVKGEIVKIRDSGRSTPLLFNHIVLSAEGKAAEELRKRARVSESLAVSCELLDHGNEEIGLKPADWHNAYAGIGAPKYILVNGNVPRDWEVKAAKLAAQGKKYGGVVKDPRTGIAFNDRYVFFFVIDGRSPISKGMTFTEAGFFCKDELKATDATLQDGGGSSTLWVDGKVRNIPSGKGKDEKYGVLRAVANGIFMAEVLPPKKSDAFKTGQSVKLKNDGELRVGPDSTFGLVGKISATAKGTILPEPLNGILSKGTHWWFCTFGDTEGWATLEQLTTSQ